MNWFSFLIIKLFPPLLFEIKFVTALFYDNAVSSLDLVRNQRFDEQEKALKKQRREVEQAKK